MNDHYTIEDLLNKAEELEKLQAKYNNMSFDMALLCKSFILMQDQQILELQLHLRDLDGRSYNFIEDTNHLIYSINLCKETKKVIHKIANHYNLYGFDKEE